MSTVASGERRRLWGMLSPFLVGLSVLIAVPAAVTVVLAFFDYDFASAPAFRGFGNFRELFSDDVFRISLRNSLVFALWAVPLRVLGAFALGLLMHERFRGASAARSAVLLPSVVPDVAYALVWLWILNPVYGPIVLAADALGLPQPGFLVSPVATQAGVVLMSVFQLAEGFLLAMAVRRDVPDELYELAAVEGAGRWASFRRLTMPLLGPALLLLLLRDTIFSLQATFVPALVVTEGGPPPYSTTYLPLFVYREGFEYLRYGYAAAATVVMLLVTANIVWLEIGVLDRWRRGLVSR